MVISDIFLGLFFKIVGAIKIHDKFLFSVVIAAHNSDLYLKKHLILLLVKVWILKKYSNYCS